MFLVVKNRIISNYNGFHIFSVKILFCKLTETYIFVKLQRNGSKTMKDSSNNKPYANKVTLKM